MHPIVSQFSFMNGIALHTTTIRLTSQFSNTVNPGLITTKRLLNWWVPLKYQSITVLGVLTPSNLKESGDVGEAHWETNEFSHGDRPLLLAHEVQRCVTGAAHHIEEGHAEGVALDGHAGHELVEPGTGSETVGW